MKKRNVFKIIDERRGNITSRYDLLTSEAIEIDEKSACKLDAVLNAFIFGYEMGVRATRSETKAGDHE